LNRPRTRSGGLNNLNVLNELSLDRALTIKPLIKYFARGLTQLR
jgi:hypothetical protein